MERPGNIPIFNIIWKYSSKCLRELFPNIPAICHDVMTFFHKYSTNIYFADGWYLIVFNTKIKKTLEV